jgi:uncharacterized protein YbjT (DUF2867 family)
LNVNPAGNGAKRVFVTGGTGFLGYRVVRALLEQGANVTVLVKPGSEDKLGVLRGRVEWVQGDPWNPASLRGRGRGHSVVVHLVGGVKPDPARGLTFRYLNYVSARNIAQMAVSDGISHMVLLSVSAAPLGISGGYTESKRDAEQYIRTTGLTWTIIRAPTLYAPGERRNPLYLLISLIGAIPLLNILLAPYVPMAVDTAARGIASLALSTDSLHDRLIRPRQLRRVGRAQERRLMPPAGTRQSNDSFDDAPDEPPFGWLP